MECKNVQKMYNLSTKVKFCARCVISNQRPRIQFDNDVPISLTMFAAFLGDL